jgi:hypothetical protein
LAHLTSAPALRCARVVMGEYDMAVKPPGSLSTGRLDGLTASERHVATLIDTATNVFRVASLRPELHYWQRRLTAGTATAAQLAAFLSKMLTDLESVPRRTPQEEQRMVTFAMPNGFADKGMRPLRRPLAKFAVEAARVLFYYYDIAPRAQGHVDARLHVAELVDAALGLSRVMALEDILREKKDALMAGKLTEESVRSLMRSAGVHLDKMPTYRAGEEELKLLA